MNHVDKIESYDIEGKGLPVLVEMKVRAFHMAPLVQVDRVMHKKCGVRVYVSIKSSYRSPEWEEKKGRSKYGEHTFRNMGATDITCDDFEDNKEVLLEVLKKETNYTRLAVYDTFIHGDYKNEFESRWVYNSKWLRQYQF